jgi:hypothetical protein
MKIEKQNDIETKADINYLFEEQTNRASVNETIEFIKQLSWDFEPIQGCISGSCLLPDSEMFEDSDIDVFVYNYTELIRVVTLLNSQMMPLNNIERLKLKNLYQNKSSLKKIGLTSHKFNYNGKTINVIYKKGCHNLLDVLSSFDIDIVCKGIDLQTLQMLDLTYGSVQKRKAGHNRWNTKETADVFSIFRCVSQYERCIKYISRGYDMQDVIEFYLCIIDEALAFEMVTDKQTETMQPLKDEMGIIRDKLIELNGGSAWK